MMYVMFKRILAAVACTALILSSAPLRANLIIMGVDATVNAGGNTTVDVLIRSDGTDNVDLANYAFQITALGGAVSTLSFSTPFDFSESNDPNYLFAGDSLGILEVPPNIPPAFPQLFTAGDLTSSGNGVNLGVSNRLLARLDLTHSLAANQTAAQANGERFQISLLNNGDTFFDDSTFPIPNPVGIAPESFSAGNSAVVTVFGAASVPEPSSLLLCGLSAIPLLRRRRR